MLTGVPRSLWLRRSFLFFVVLTFFSSALFGCMGSKTIPASPKAPPSQGKKLVYSLSHHPLSSMKSLSKTNREAQKDILQKRLGLLELYDSFAKVGTKAICVFISSTDMGRIDKEADEHRKQKKAPPNWYERIFQTRRRYYPLSVSSRLKALQAAGYFNMFAVEDDESAAVTYVENVLKTRPRTLKAVRADYFRMSGPKGMDRYLWSESKAELLAWVNAENKKLEKDPKLDYQWVIGEFRRGPLTVIWRTYLLESKPLFSSNPIKKTYLKTDPAVNRTVLGLDLTKKASRIFATWTGSHTGQRIALVVDNIVQSAPVVQTRISGGKIQVTPGRLEHDAAFHHVKAMDLTLDPSKAGSLPFSMSLLSTTAYKKLTPKVSACP